jgi:hypothetical protein
MTFKRIGNASSAVSVPNPYSSQGNVRFVPADNENRTASSAPARQLPQFESTAAGHTPVEYMRKADLGMGDSRELLVGSSGEMNASTKREQIQNIDALLKAASRGELRQTRPKTAAQVQARIEAMRAAYYTRDAANFQEMGEFLSDEIWATIRRESFLEKILDTRVLGQGEIARIRVRQNDVRAFVMGTDSKTPESIVKPREIYPAEYYVQAFITIEEKEIARNSSDILGEKLEDGREQIGVQYDQVLKGLLDSAAADNGLTMNFTNLTPQIFTSMVHGVQGRGKLVSSVWMADDLWVDIITHSSFSNWFDPVAKHQLILTGELGTMLNVTLYTDSFLESSLRVLERGDIYFLAAPKLLGQHMIRSELRAEPVPMGVLGRAARGWFLTSTSSTAIADSRGVSKAKKLY